MSNTILGFGLVCIAAAIIGGGFSAAGATVPVITNRIRQVLLGVFGVIVVLGATRGGNHDTAASPDHPTAEHRGDAGAAATPPRQLVAANPPIDPCEESNEPCPAGTVSFYEVPDVPNVRLYLGTTQLSGATYDAFKTSTGQECLNACLRSNDCSAAAWGGGTELCTLKTGTLGPPDLDVPAASVYGIKERTGESAHP